ncbi:MAG: YlxR family protein [Cyanobacteria bacterium P01_F01_bin.42]
MSCRRLGPKSNFWRIVRAHPTGLIQINCGEGRSAYLCRNLTCLELAQKKRRLSRSLKAPVTSEIYQILFQQLNEQLND